MASLTAKQESFIKLMTESDELARRGFELLLKRANFDAFFDALQEAGLFDSARNPAPVPVEPSGSVRLPYWNALDYLVAVAKVAGERDDQSLANKVLDVVRSVSRESGARTRDNYHTWRKLAEIIGLVPRAAVTLEDVQLIPDWLGSRFDRGMVGRALDEGALRTFLASDSDQDLEKAVEILRHCTAILWVDATESGEGTDKPVTVVDDYQLKQLIDSHAAAFGAKTGRRAAKICLERVREVFRTNRRGEYSRSYRPAVEDHEQNHRWNGPENRSVDGLRKVLLGWCDSDPVGVKTFVEALLRDNAEIVRRIGIYVLGERWTDLRSLYLPVAGAELFQSGHLHELYNLLEQRFGEMSDEEKNATVEAIRNLPRPTWGDDPDRSLKRRQRQWLSAIVGKGHLATDAWNAELTADASIGIPEHPDFDTYMQISFSPGPAPYDVQELVTFAREGVIVEKLNAFVPSDTWRGPTMEALVAKIEEAVRTAPESFLELLPQFLTAKRPFQHALIWGLKQVWDAPSDKGVKVDWDRWWEKLVGFFEQVVGAEELWTEKIDEKQDFVPNRDWISSSVADFLKAGTQNDERAYAEDLLPRTRSLIELLLINARAVDQPSDDAMTQAINSPKGKAVEALFSQTLRGCRVADLSTAGHAEAWANMRPLFEAELAKCKNSNYEFSTLCGAYLAHLDYVDPEWLGAAVNQMFPSDFAANAACAVDGLAYAHANRRVYGLLVANGIVDRALRFDLKGRYALEKLIERVAVAYLWGDEELDSPRFSFLFGPGRDKDLEYATHFFWSASGEHLSDVQKERILAFWERCIAWANETSERPAKLMSALSTLSCYLKSVEGREGDLLLAVAPYVVVGHNAEHFVEGLRRFVDESPARVSAILGKLLETYQPFFDYEDHLKSLLVRLAENGRREDAIKYAERLRDLQGMQELFDRLTHGA